MKIQRYSFLVTSLIMLTFVAVSATSGVVMAAEDIEISLWGGWSEIEPVYQEAAQPTQQLIPM